MKHISTTMCFQRDRAVYYTRPPYDTKPNPPTFPILAVLFPINFVLPTGVPGPRGWNPQSPPPPDGCFSFGGGDGEGTHTKHPLLTVGLIVDSVNAGRLVDKGPPAENGPAARKFREFWGDKSELRRWVVCVFVLSL